MHVGTLVSPNAGGFGEKRVSQDSPETEWMGSI